MENKKSIGVVVSGVLLIIYSIITFSYFLFYWHQIDFRFSLAAIMFIVFFLPISSLTISSGIGVLNMENWSRKVTLYTICPYIPVLGFNFIKDDFSNLGILIIGCVVLVLALIFYFTRPSVKAIFTENKPSRVKVFGIFNIGIGILAVMWSILMLLTGIRTSDSLTLQTAGYSFYFSVLSIIGGRMMMQKT